MKPYSQNILYLTQKCKHLCSQCIALGILGFFPMTFLLRELPNKINALDLLDMVFRVMCFIGNRGSASSIKSSFSSVHMRLELRCGLFKAHLRHKLDFDYSKALSL